MCIAIYVAVFGLLYLYSDYVIGQYVLAASGEGQELMVVAVGWEMAASLWPVLLMAMAAASLVSVLVVKRCRSCTVTS